MHIFSQFAVLLWSVKSSLLGQNGRHFTDDIFRCIFVNKKFCILIKFSLKCVPKGQINSIAALVQIMAWCRIGDKPLSKPKNYADKYWVYNVSYYYYHYYSIIIVIVFIIVIVVSFTKKNWKKYFQVFSFSLFASIHKTSLGILIVLLRPFNVASNGVEWLNSAFACDDPNRWILFIWRPSYSWRNKILIS